MKTKILFLAALICASVCAHAQFVQGPTVQSLLTNINPWEVLPADGGSVATNVPVGQAKWATVGGSGFGVAIKAYGTNAALTTNTWITLEPGISIGGTIYPVTNTLPVVVFLPTGVATNTYYTNFPSTTLNLGNISAIRIKSIMQTNGVIGGSLAGRLFIEKFTISTR